MDSKTFLNILGERIRAIRKSKKMSQERLAELSGLHPTYISDVERGKVNASIYSCFVITEALNITFLELVGTQTNKKTIEIENDLAVVAGLIRKLDRKKQTLVLSAVKGMLGAIEKI